MKENSRIYSVKQVNAYVKDLFAQDFILQDIHVRGEISNLKYHSSGHIYFSLKDDSGVIAAVMFASDAIRLRFRLENGSKVIVTGRVGVYERDGKYQLYARQIENDGEGDLAKQFEELKRKLTAEGIFDSVHKKPIPRYSMNIGVVTAETGAVINDIFNVASRRNPYCKITLCPASVQGEGAAQTICTGIKTLDRLGLDVIIVGRGGGSIEDLWAFNEEPVAKAIYNAQTPIISAVGHETDFTIADFAADLRAPTPSAAAELAVFDYERFSLDLSRFKFQLDSLINTGLRRAEERTEKYKMSLELRSPSGRLQDRMQTVQSYSDLLEKLMQGRLRESEVRLVQLSERLSGLSPLERLSQGYAYVSDGSGHNLKSIKQTVVGDTITIGVSDGMISAQVLKLTEVKR